MKIIKSNNNDMGCNEVDGKMVCYGQKGHLINAQKVMFTLPGESKPNSDFNRLIAQLKQTGTQIDIKENTISAKMTEEEAMKIADKFHVIYKI